MREDYTAPEKKFIIFFHGRSGSELLVSLLNSHPEIHCDQEIYLHRKALFPKRYLENRAKMSGKNIYGHKAKIVQLDRQYADKDRVKKEFFTDYKIIHLHRRNYLRQAISGILSHFRQTWHDTKESPLEGKKFVFNFDKLMNQIQWIEKCKQREKEILEGLDYLYICYEDDLLDNSKHQQTLDKIFDYLDVESVPVGTNLFRTTSDQLSDFIENYDEIAEAVKKTKYAKFLDE